MGFELIFSSLGEIIPFFPDFPQAMFNRKFFFVLAFLSILSGLQASFAPQVSEYFITENAEFEINPEKQVVEYDVVLRARKPLPLGSVIQVRFQNPLRKGEDIVKELLVEANKRAYRISSGNVAGLKLGKDYRIDVVLFTSSSQQTELGNHSQRLFFEVPKKKYKKEVKSWYEKMGDSSASESSAPKKGAPRSPRGKGVRS